MLEGRPANRLVGAYRDSLQIMMASSSYPRPDALDEGLPVNEAILWLLCLHEDTLTRLANLEGRLMARTIRRFGDEDVGLLLFQTLADVYGMSVTGLLDGFTRNRSVEPTYERDLQPWTADGLLDSSLLIPESDDILLTLSTGAGANILDGYAMGNDPRAPLVRSRIAMSRWGVAWVNVVRPHHHEEIDFNQVQSIHQSWPKENVWSVVSDDLRLRLFRPLPNDSEDFIRAWRETLPKLSGGAGLEWSHHFSGRRRQ